MGCKPLHLHIVAVILALLVAAPAEGDDITDLQLLTEELLRMDDNNVYKQLIITGGGPKLLAIENPASIFTRETYAALRDLQLNGEYVPDVNEAETITPDREKKQNAFIDAIMKTSVMKMTEKFLQEKGRISDNEKLSDVMKTIWFTLYSRSRNGKKKGSSGFEHVFRGEIVPWKGKGEVIGFHNWVFTFFEQYEPTTNPNFVYTPPLDKYVDLNDKGKLVEIKFHWHRLTKYKTESTSMFIGTSPELEMAVYTVCFLMELETCPVKMAMQPFNIKTKKKDAFVGTTYPEVPS